MEYKQISNWDCGATCIAFIAGKDPAVIRDMAKAEVKDTHKGIDPYELEDLMDRLDICYQPIILSELNHKFCDRSMLLMLISMSKDKKDVTKINNHWVMYDCKKLYDPRIGMQNEVPLDLKRIQISFTILRIYIINRGE